MQYSTKWDLDSIFKGGTNSGELLEELKGLSAQISSLKPAEGVQDVVELIEQMQQIDLLLRECDAFILCLQSQDAADEAAGVLRAEFSALNAKFELFNNRFDTSIAKLDAPTFQALLQHPQIAPIAFIMKERRERICQKLPCEQENMITALCVDGYQGWGQLYPQLVAEVTIPFGAQELSFGQAENQMTHPDRSIRRQVFHSLEGAWKKKEGLFASVLNHIAGFSLQVNAMRGIEDPLHFPLFENRMKKETLDAMWGAVAASKEPLIAFMQAKASMLGVEKLSWYDLEAPLFASNSDPIPYDTAVAWIIEAFEKFHPPMAEFARKACSQHWIEAEDRPGKRPGGYCAAFPRSRMSRIFMTYSGTIVNVSTLAHELGHAYHTAMLDDLPSFAQHYRMNVAETASTLAEHIVSDALLLKANTKEQKLQILSDRIQRSIVFMMNIHARFLFELAFYEKRKTQSLSATDLNSLMEQAQKRAYCHALSEWHPHFWSAKLHFYFTDIPFYNFPYTFGFLFSLGIYAKGADCDALLRESGMMSVEDLAKKHLGVDLTQPAFWQSACARAICDVDLFLQECHHENRL